MKKCLQDRVEVVCKGLPSHAATAGLATVFFESETERDAACTKLNCRMLDGRAIMVSLEGFVAGNILGQPAAISD